MGGPGPGPGEERGALAQLCGSCPGSHASLRGEGPAGFSPSTQMWAPVAPNMAFAVSVEEVWGKCRLGLGSRLAVCPRDGCHSPGLAQPPRRQGRGRPCSGRAASLQAPGTVSEVHPSEATPAKGISRTAPESGGEPGGASLGFGRDLPHSCSVPSSFLSKFSCSRWFLQGLDEGMDWPLRQCLQVREDGGWAPSGPHRVFPAVSRSRWCLFVDCQQQRYGELASFAGGPAGRCGRRGAWGPAVGQRV